MCCLMLKDNIRASAVCKAWHEAAEFVLIVGKHPWVFSFPKHSDLINIIDPLQRITYTLFYPHLLEPKFVTPKMDGCLLSYGNIQFFFNPFTWELKSLPKYELFFQAIAFSSAPISGTFTVIALFPFTSHISLLYPGATEWSHKDISCPHGFGPCVHSNILYVNGHFYCLDSRGALLDFDLASRTVTFQLWEEQVCPFVLTNEWRSHRNVIYLMEQKGELLVMYTFGTEAPLMYKLVSSKWEEMTGTTLNGLVIFAGMGNSVYFSKCRLHAKRCLSYSLDKGRYYLRKRLLVPEKPWKSLQCPRRSIWSQPPSENDFDFI